MKKEDNEMCTNDVKIRDELFEEVGGVLAICKALGMERSEALRTIAQYDFGYPEYEEEIIEVTKECMTIVNY